MVFLCQPKASEVSLQGQGDKGSCLETRVAEGLSAREGPVWVVSGQRADGAIWSPDCRWGWGIDARWMPMPGSLSPEGHPGPGVVQPLQRAQVVRQRVLGIAGQDGKDHGGQRRLCDARSLEPRPQQEQQLEQRDSGGSAHGGRSGGCGGPRGSQPSRG